MWPADTTAVWLLKLSSELVYPACLRCCDHWCPPPDAKHVPRHPRRPRLFKPPLAYICATGTDRFSCYRLLCGSFRSLQHGQGAIYSLPPPVHHQSLQAISRLELDAADGWNHNGGNLNFSHAHVQLGTSKL